ncbi:MULTISPECIES: PLD nuclease N-terminal domain-containing protein [unclassified Clostridioides]|uniref:PLD nuclease N-terminal domain-containing protein n=1 Tax=unclassified Clostridioides TaxID=2635829 RepID=UPI001D12CA5D|nr:PLDc_N domain-containing protein [Clostridioides sp. ZZV14-6150]MCC0660975.1 PLDc_N domain-containing protein [Clostridioides sp. ZZV14-6154]MCC0668309.1 PLDc_N domain-containing protein [Clostridioides sp. ZZV14-6153]MCC0720257.1 PLDc_N domain-containing protein [Clostridioides sp. ZZV14-6105]MCC0722604.1 PLDc_N domain-containing protein [Clostridioides sp. ZZV14-6104]MCC0728386.1 PLDc_N domain-containing protein [Clostridioides sp. ZZV14-6045]MCC0729827.1 PLDc_N domain-containing protein
MENLMEYLPLLLPVIILNLILVITALIHIIKHPNYKIGNKAIWILLVLFISIIGPILYFTIGRGDE